jgi:tetrahydromethanopterin S-methyltransferase subunit B
MEFEMLPDKTDSENL